MAAARTSTRCCCCRSAGPRGPSRCVPFLENVTRGRGIPPERLDAVAEHYLHFGGVSPINGINRALIDADRGRTGRPRRATAGLLRQPQLGALRRRYRCCNARQRDSARGGVHHIGLGRLLRLRPVPGGHRPGTCRGRRGRAGTGQAAAVLRPPAAGGDVRRRDRDAAATLPERCAPGPDWCSPRIRSRCARRSRCGPDLYSRQVGYAAGLVAAAAGYADYDQVWQSRSGPPQVPWLEPDVGRTPLGTGRGAAPRRSIVCPIGFVADHIEVVWDLDNELREQADDAGHRARAGPSTPNAQRRFARLVVRPDRRTARRPRAAPECRR